MKMTKRKLIVKKTTRRLRLKNKNKRKTRRYVGGGGLDLFGIKRRREAREAREAAAFEKWNEAKKDKQMSNENKWAEENKDRNEQKKICKNIPKRIKEINERIASIEATLIPINEKMAAEDLNKVYEDGSEILDDKQNSIKLTIKGQYDSNRGEWYDEDHDFPVSLDDIFLYPYNERVRETDLTTYNYYKPTAIELNNERNKLSKELDSLAKEKENLEKELKLNCKDLFDDNIEEAESWNKVECPYIEDELKHINKEIQKIDETLKSLNKESDEFRKRIDDRSYSRPSDSEYNSNNKRSFEIRKLNNIKTELLNKKKEKKAEFEQRECVLNALSSESNTDDFGN
jgi:hypothetical protein